jgi:hypothetical protein
MKIISYAEDGFSHIIVPLVVIVGVAIIGSYFLVASHADPLTVKGSCSISGVATNVADGAAVTPVFTVNNLGTKPFTVTLTGSEGLSNSQGGKGGPVDFTITVNPGSSGQSQPGQVGTIFGEAGYRVVVEAKATNPRFGCSVSSKITPQTPLSTLTTIITNLDKGVSTQVTASPVTIPGPISNATGQPIVFTLSGQTYYAYRQEQEPDFSTTPAQTASTMVIVDGTKGVSVTPAYLDKGGILVDSNQVAVGFSTGGD